MAEIKVTPSVLRSKADELQNGVRNLSQKNIYLSPHICVVLVLFKSPVK